MSDHIASVKAFVITIPRDDPYMGGLRPGEEPNEQGYFVREKNRTVYPTVDRSVVVKMETAQGVVGWGETYGIIAPGATVALIEELLAAFIIGRDPLDREAVHDDLYDLMRVRGYTGGFYLDALAALDIALWDIAAKQSGVSLAKLIGGQRHQVVPAYFSGLPKPTLNERAELAAHWFDQGFDSFKFAAPVADDGVVQEIKVLREVLGDKARIACDMHWMHGADEAIGLIRSMEAHKLWFAEAPVKTENVKGLAKVARSVATPIAAGEEWRTVFDAAARIEQQACGIVQPEMGHTGITEFMRIARYAEVHHLEVIPHATIGVGIFLAASLQASAAIAACTGHEFQHSIFEKNLRYLDTDFSCEKGFYSIPSGLGLGVSLDEAAVSPYIS